ncbi:MAG: hypothetical protein J6T23_02395 [Elusimicrobia bacterium]|nr:hypothetical protein [Elusimicrobiota bacterium]
MEFSEPYLTYEEYRALGGTLDLTPFNLLEFEARRRIDIRTQNRLKGIDSNDIPPEVKICEFKMIDSMSSYDETLSNVASNGNVASENTDGYSVSYITSDKVSDVISSKNKELNTIMYECLVGVIVNGEHIMYAGVR